MRESSTQSADEQLSDFIAKQELPLPKDLILDGKHHRFGRGEKGREPHWYVGSRSGEKISLTIGSHKDESAKVHFRSKTPYQPYWRKGASLAEKWESSQAWGVSPYLERKKIDSFFGTRINYFGDLVIPMRTCDGVLVGLQTITKDGKKLFVTGSKKKAAYFELESSDLDKSRIFISEGFATAASVCMATKCLTVCAFDSGNLPLVTETLKRKYPQSVLIVTGDDDRFGEENAGRKAAQKVSQIAQSVFPLFSSDEDHLTDWNDLHVRKGLEAVREQIEKAFQKDSNKPLIQASVSTEVLPETPDMVSGWELESAEPPSEDQFVLPGLLRGHVGILCAPGGYGKSGVALLIANQIASGGTKDFLGFGTLQSGSTCIVSIEDPLAVFSQRQRSIKLDFTPEEYDLIDKNIHLINATSQQNQLDAKFIISSVLKALSNKQQDPQTFRLLIIDHLSYWTFQDLNDGGVCREIIKEFKEIAQTLNCVGKKILNLTFVEASNSRTCLFLLAG